ncbi:CoA pyrophosphatase [Candidatus Sumerlaeota bacterium]|nr:CoA pyrophosphatase [Candidatus Sumerlaeota bacterium]
MQTANSPRSLSDYGLSEIAQRVMAHKPLTEPSAHAPKRAAVAIILRESPDASGIQTLFLKRAEHPLDPWSGHMAFPGGHQDEADESLEAAARREAFEEVGISLDPAMNIGRLSDIHGGRLRETGMTVSPFVYTYSGPADLVLSDEVADTVWVPLSHLADPASIKPYVYHLDPLKRNFPSIRFGPFSIWGMTYRMVGDLLELFGVAIPGETAMTEIE